MAAITAAMVGELRAKTDAPMMECKKALTEAEGDMERAEELNIALPTWRHCQHWVCMARRLKKFAPS